MFSLSIYRVVSMLLDLDVDAARSREAQRTPRRMGEEEEAGEGKGWCDGRQEGVSPAASVATSSLGVNSEEGGSSVAGREKRK